MPDGIGVEIFSNQSGDNVFYGPIEHIDVERGGDDYDVIFWGVQRIAEDSESWPDFHNYANELWID